MLRRRHARRSRARSTCAATVSVGRDVFIDVNVVLEGKVALGDRVRIGPNCYLKDCSIGADTELHPNCVIDRASIGARCSIGPFARLRPGAGCTTKCTSAISSR